MIYIYIYIYFYFYAIVCCPPQSTVLFRHSSCVLGTFSPFYLIMHYISKHCFAMHHRVLFLHVHAHTFHVFLVHFTFSFTLSTLSYTKVLFYSGPQQSSLFLYMHIQCIFITFPFSTLLYICFAVLNSNRVFSCVLRTLSPFYLIIQVKAFV